MPQYTATITKSNKSQPIGIGLANDPNYGIIISSIKPEGPLGESCLKKGMRLLKINGVDISSLTSKEAVFMLKGSEGKLVLLAEHVVPSDISFIADKQYRRDDGVILSGMMKHDKHNAMPTIFTDAGVPTNTYFNIYRLIETDLLPAAAALRIHEVTLERELGSYVSTQMVTGGMIGFGTESSHEKKIYEMVLKTSHLQRNVDLKAMQVLMQVNAMLSKHNLMATVALESISNGKLSKHARKKYEKLNVSGLQFHAVD